MSLANYLTRPGKQGWLERVDPRFKLSLLAWISTLGVLCDSTFALVTLALLALAWSLGLRLSPRGRWVLGGMLAAIAWGTMLSQSLFYGGLPRTTLVTLVEPQTWRGWQFSGVELYREGFAYGLKQSLRMAAVTLAGLTVCLSTSPERLFAALARLRVPAAIGFMTVAALRMLPLLVSEYGVARQARWLRRGDATLAKASGRISGWRRRRGETTALFVPVLAATLRRATTLATSVSSRGFDPAVARTYYPPLAFRRWERLALAALAVSWLAIAVAKTLYAMYLADFYYRPGLRGLYTFVREWL